MLALTLNIQKKKDHGTWSHHFMANDVETTEIVTDSIFLGSKTTADGDCSHEIKRRLLLGRKNKPRQHIKNQKLLCQQRSI